MRTRQRLQNRLRPDRQETSLAAGGTGAYELLKTTSGNTPLMSIVSAMIPPVASVRNATLVGMLIEADGV